MRVIVLLGSTSSEPLAQFAIRQVRFMPKDLTETAMTVLRASNCKLKVLALNV